MPELKYPKISGYRLTDEVGGGGFSSVFRAVNVDDHRVAACKVVHLTPKTTAIDRKTLEKEMRVHAALKHRHVLEFINAVIVELDAKSPYVPAVYMLLEFAAGGDLFDKIAPDVGVDEDIAHYYFCQLIEGLNYIHLEGVCHRDLKPENLLLDAAGTLKISDFGLCSVYKLKESGRTRMLSERCGSLPYVAPELDGDKPYAAEPVDVWGVGVILFTLLAGNTPWDEPTVKSPEYRRYRSGEYVGDEPWSRMSSDVLSLITRLLDINPETRATLADAFSHPWVHRPSQYATQGVAVLAEKLTESLYKNGDMDVANPDMESQAPEQTEDGDVDQAMTNTVRNSQFTQSLMLFSQTQGGNRYQRELTRFYASIPPHQLYTLVDEVLRSFGCKTKPAPNNPPPPSQISDNMDTEEVIRVRLRVGGMDARRVQFKGWVIMETFNSKGNSGTYCVFQRSDGNPISWRQVWKAVIMDRTVEPHLFRKRR